VFEGMDAGTAREVARRFALPLVAVAAAPPATPPPHPVDLTRLALYHSWHDTQDEGWSRFTFEQYGVPYTSIDKDDVRRGKLRQRFDVILVPQTRGDAEQLVHGINRKWGPLPFQKTAQTPNLGTPGATADMTGGPGFEGMGELQRFVEEGGALITLGNSTRMASRETGLVRELGPVTTRTLFHPGSVVRARTRRADSPMLYGYPETFTIFRGNGPLFSVATRDSAMLVLQYGTRIAERPRDEGEMMGMPRGAATVAGGERRDTSAAGRAAGAPPGAQDYVVSGMVRGQEEIVGQGAIFDIPVRNGRVVAFTFDPLHRFLNHHEFPLVWNAIMNWNDRPGAARGGPDAKVVDQP
jgi:hypothetical protein